MVSIEFHKKQMKKKVTRNNTTSEHQALPAIHWSVSVPARLSRKTARKSKRGQSGGGAAAGFTATSGGIRYLFDSATRHFHVSASLFFLSSLASSSYFRAFPATTRLSHDIEYHSVEFCRYSLYSFPAWSCDSNNAPLLIIQNVIFSWELIFVQLFYKLY